MLLGLITKLTDMINTAENQDFRRKTNPWLKADRIALFINFLKTLHNKTVRIKWQRFAHG